MSDTVQCAVHLTRDWLSIRQALQDAFGVEFAFWEQQPQGWTEVQPASSECEPAQLPVPPELDQLGDEQHPCTFPAEGGALTLAVPLTIRANRVIAVAQVPAGDADQTVRFANLVLREFNQRREVQRMTHENQAFLRQVTNDFEELTFLRGMAELLEISDLSFDFTAMSESVLPTLNPLCEADTMVLVTARQPEHHRDTLQVDRPQQWCGPRVIDDATCTRLVERYRQSCETQPVVRNHFHKTPEGKEFPGVHSFVLVPIVNGQVVIGWLLALNRNNDRNLMVEEAPWEVSYMEFGTHEATLMSSSAAILATHARNVELFREREHLLVSVVRALVSAIEAKDEYTRGHSERVALYGKCLARELGLGDEYCERLYLTGLLHDVGKIGVRDAVLRKPGPLTDEEFEEIKQHPDKGWAILQDLKPLFYVLPGVLHHHEQVDGRGYPDRLSDDDIPLDGRILAVADAYDAMTSDRPYRPGMPQEKAEAILRSGAGTQWDGEMIDAFFRIMPEIVRIKQTYEPAVAKQRRK